MARAGSDRSVLVGREEELEAALAVCRAAAEGRGSVLVVRGEPGIGKTALLDAVGSADPSWPSVRAAGVETESAVAFATLQSLIWPLREELGELEPDQAALLRGVLELGPQHGASTFAVGAALLSLLSIAARERALLAIVDDAQWADIASQEALAFAARRLQQEPIALFVGARVEERSLLAEERSFPRLELGPLEPDAARSLLDHAGLAPEVADRLIEASAGNPLGLTELPQLLSEAQRLGREPIPEAFEAGPLVQRAFAARAEALSDEGREALLLLAAAGEHDLVHEGLAEAESAGLVVRRPGLDFPHPLMRAAVYAAATPAARRGAHRHLAEITTGARRAWHLADAAVGPDEAAAAALEDAARDAALVGGVAAQAQAFERSADLTPETEERVARLLESARAWRLAGRMERADAVIDRAIGLAATPESRARVQLERGRALVRNLENQQAIDLLVAEAERIEPLDRKLAGLLLVEAAQASEVHLGAARTTELAERAHSLAGGDGDRAELATVNMLIAARAMANAPPDERDVALLGRASELLELRELRAGAEEAHWISYCLAVQERDAEARRLSDRAMGEARAAGDVWSLCFGLYARAAVEEAVGRVDVARSFAIDALALAQEVGETWRLGEAHAVLAEVEAVRGDVAACKRELEGRREHIAEAAYQRDWAWGVSLPLGLALLGAGEHESAAAELEAALEFSRSVTGPRTWYHFVPLELAEAYARLGRGRDAETLVREVAPEIESCWLVRPRAKLARIRGLLAPEAKVDATFAQAAALLEERPQHLEQARVELNWGERLRGAGRSADAVGHLEHALARFESLGAVGWAERARSELEAASGTTRPAQPRRTDVLTAQELRVARHAAAGMRDREIAAKLYLSPRTVESYLQSAYRKLGVSNRTQLAGILAADSVSLENP